MKLYLIKRQYLDLGNTVQVNDKTFLQNSQKLELEFSPSENSSFQRDICTKLEKKLAEITLTNSKLKSVNTNSIEENEAQVVENGDGGAGGLSKPTVDNKGTLLQILICKNPNDARSVEFRVEGTLLDELKTSLFPGENVRLKLTLTEFLTQYLGRTFYETNQYGQRMSAARLEGINSLLSLSTNDMEIKATSDHEVAYSENSVPVPDIVWNSLVNSGHQVSGYFSLELLVNSFAEPTVEQLQVYKNILENSLATDFSIIAGNGNDINCHKALLLGHNIEAFQSMLSNHYKEGKTGKLEMRDMSEEGVRALLAYLYYSSLDEPSRKCDIAFELLKAADKYGICTLTTRMIDIFLGKSDEWFSVEVALGLFQIANVFDNDRHGEDLRKRAVEVLKTNSPKLAESEELKTLLREDPASGIQLMQYFCDAANPKRVKLI